MGSSVYLHNNDAILQVFGLRPAPSNAHLLTTMCQEQKKILPPLGSVHSSEMRDTHGYLVLTYRNTYLEAIWVHLAVPHI